MTLESRRGGDLRGHNNLMIFQKNMDFYLFFFCLIFCKLLLDNNIFEPVFFFMFESFNFNFCCFIFLQKCHISINHNFSKSV